MKSIYNKRKKRNKYGNIKITVGKKVYDSKAEYKYIKELELKQKAGYISDLKTKPRYILLESFKDNQNNTIRQISYKPEAYYIENGQETVLEVKSKPTKTEAYIIRKKLFLKRYPHIKFIEITT